MRDGFSECYTMALLNSGLPADLPETFQILAGPAGNPRPTQNVHRRRTVFLELQIWTQGLETKGSEGYEGVTRLHPSNPSCCFRPNLPGSFITSATHDCFICTGAS